MTARTLLISAGLAAVAIGVGVALNSVSAVKPQAQSLGDSATAHAPRQYPAAVAPVSARMSQAVSGAASAGAVAFASSAAAVSATSAGATVDPAAANLAAISTPAVQGSRTHRLLREALASRQHQYRLSEMIAPPPFDAAAFARDPQAYLDEPAPGRVYQTMRAGPEVPRLALEGSARFAIAYGGDCVLAVRVPAGAPVAWLVFDGGCLENGLTSQTVRADATGLARIRYRALPGVTGDVNILAGSPMASGQQPFLVVIETPEPSRSPALTVSTSP